MEPGLRPPSRIAPMSAGRMAAQAGQDLFCGLFGFWPGKRPPAFLRGSPRRFVRNRLPQPADPAGGTEEPPAFPEWSVRYFPASATLSSGSRHSRGSSGNSAQSSPFLIPRPLPMLDAARVPGSSLAFPVSIFSDSSSSEKGILLLFPDSPGFPVESAKFSRFPAFPRRPTLRLHRSGLVTAPVRRLSQFRPLLRNFPFSFHVWLLVASCTAR